MRKRLKQLLVIAVSCCFFTLAIGQRSHVISGDINYLPIGYIHFEYLTKDYKLVDDTNQINSEGKYFHEVKGSSLTQRGNIIVGKSVASEVFIALGFALVFSADAAKDGTLGI